MAGTWNQGDGVLPTVLGGLEDIGLNGRHAPAGDGRRADGGRSRSQDPGSYHLEARGRINQGCELCFEARRWVAAGQGLEEVAQKLAGATYLIISYCTVPSF